MLSGLELVDMVTGCVVESALGGMWAVHGIIPGTDRVRVEFLGPGPVVRGAERMDLHVWQVANMVRVA